MWRIALVVAIGGLMALPAASSAHPGNTDAAGGHHCWTNCASWGLVYGQYHFHGGYTPPAPVTPAITNNDLYATRSFQSPSRNIWCVYRGGLVGCTVGNLNKTAYIGESGTAWVRRGAIRLARAPVLSYGAWWLGPIGSQIGCKSSRTGMTCVNGGVHGFDAARAGIWAN